MNAANNINSVVRTDNCFGSVYNNVNVIVKAFNSHLRLMNNVNATVNVNASSVEFKNNVNVTLAGEKHSWDIENCTNFVGAGDVNDGTVANSTNVGVRGSNLTGLELSNNANVNVYGVGGTVTARNCTDVTFTGNDHDAIILNAKNLQITRSTVDKRNVFLVIPTNGNISRFYAEYEEEAYVKGYDYSLGEFRFQLTSEETDVLMNFPDLKGGSISFQTVGQACISSTELTEDLYILGPRVRVDDDNETVRISRH